MLFEGSLSPWALFGETPLLISPYLMASATLGYVLMYGVIMLTGVTKKTFFNKLSLKVVWAVAGVLAVGLIVRNASVVNAGPVRFVNDVAEQAIDEMDENAWLVSSSFMNKLFVIKAANRHSNLRMINPSASRSKVYLRYLKDQMESPRYQSLAHVGVLPLLKEMLEDEETGYKNVQAYDLSDLFRANELRAIPHPLHYSAVALNDVINLDDLIKEHEGFISSIQQGGDIPVWSKGEFPYVDDLLRHVSRNANNLGVLAYEEGRMDLAEQSFNQALQLNAHNVSALLNRVVLINHVKTEWAPQYQEDLKAHLLTQTTKTHLWNLAFLHGYVIDPEAFALEGYTWALSGSHRRGVEALKKAQRQIGPRPDIQLVLSGLYAAQGDLGESRRALDAVFKSHPDSPEVLLRLSRSHVQSGEYEEAGNLLERVRSMEGFRHRAELELALLSAMKGDVESAQKELLEITRLNSDDMRSWMALLAVSMDVNNADEVIEKALSRLKLGARKDPSISMLFARVLYHRGDYQGAADALESALRSQPYNVSFLEFALQVDRAAGDVDLARKHVSQLLSLGSRNPLANRIMGSLQIHDQHYALAESSFEVSFAVEPDSNTAADLAWLLQRRGKLDDALHFADQALSLNENSGSAWHTRGLVLFRLGEYERATSDLLKALVINIDNPYAQLYLSMVYSESGDEGKARELLEKLEPVRTRLSVELQDELSRVTTKLARKAE